MAPISRKYRVEDQPDSSDIEKRISEYIDNQHIVLWGQFFDIESKEGNRRAKEFILDLLIDLGITNEQVE